MIPVYIINRNRLAAMRKLIAWLLDAGTERIVIVDNDSQYPPLVDYYKHDLEQGVTLVHAGRNAGPQIFWEREMQHWQDTPYVVTDSDLVPSACCPKDLIAKLDSILKQYVRKGKAGPNLRIDNLPDVVPFKHKIIQQCQGFWQHRLSHECFEAAIDTTFALYRAHSNWVDSSPASGIRMDFPYVMEHTPWYSWPLTEEDEYFGRTCLTAPISNIAGYWKEAGWKG